MDTRNVDIAMYRVSAPVELNMVAGGFEAQVVAGEIMQREDL
jgi:hypothetical protein